MRSSTQLNIAYSASIAVLHAVELRQQGEHQCANEADGNHIHGSDAVAQHANSASGSDRTICAATVCLWVLTILLQ